MSNIITWFGALWGCIISLGHLYLLEQQTVHFLNHSQRVYKADEPPYLHFGHKSLARKALAQIQRTNPGASLLTVWKLACENHHNWSEHHTLQYFMFLYMLPAVFILFLYNNSQDLKKIITCCLNSSCSFIQQVFWEMNILQWVMLNMKWQDLYGA